MSAPKTILMVEDDSALRELIVDALEAIGYRVLPAADGHAALQLLSSGPVAPDAIFSDVSMPNGMSGIDLAIEATRMRPGLRVVLASGYAPSQLPPMPPEVSFLPKPYRLPQVLELLERPGAAG